MNGQNPYDGYPYQTPYYGGGYSSPYYPPQQQAPQQPSMNTNKLYAAGIEDVRCRRLPNNSDFIFLDNDNPIIYRKTTDSTGKMDIQVFKIIPYEEKPAPQADLSQYVLKTDFDALKSEIEKLKEDSVKAEAPKPSAKKTTGGTI